MPCLTNWVAPRPLRKKSGNIVCYDSSLKFKFYVYLLYFLQYFSFSFHWFFFANILQEESLSEICYWFLWFCSGGLIFTCGWNRGRKLRIFKRDLMGNGGFEHHFNPFKLNILFSYPLKTSDNQTFSDVFRWYRAKMG